MIQKYKIQFPSSFLKIAKYAVIATLLSFQIIQIYLLQKIHFQPQVAIVPHHNVVADIRNDYLNQVSRSRFATKTIIVLSPDHFSPSQNQISYSPHDWNLSNGLLNYDVDIGSLITKNQNNNPSLIYQDHGIFNLLSQIKSNFPQASIIPILIGSHVSQHQLVNLVSTFNQHCLSDCLIISSVDFSHYLPPPLADIHDIYSQKILSSLDIQSYQNLEVDSPQSLYISMRFAQLHNARNFKIYAHTNSGKLTKNYDVESTSHVMASYSRTLNFNLNSNNSAQNFTLATNLDRDASSQTVGDRFFYGVDYIDTQLNQPYQPDPQIKIRPSDISSISYQDKQLNIHLGQDFIISGSVTNNSKLITILPIDPVTHFFLRSESKKNALQKLFKDTYLNVDLDSGTFILD